MQPLPPKKNCLSIPENCLYEKHKTRLVSCNAAQINKCNFIFWKIIKKYQPHMWYNITSLLFAYCWTEWYRNKIISYCRQQWKSTSEGFQPESSQSLCTHWNDFFKTKPTELLCVFFWERKGLVFGLIVDTRQSFHKNWFRIRKL